MGGKVEGSGMGSGSWHRLNQRGEKIVRDRNEKGFGRMDRVVKAALRKERIEREETQALEEDQQGGLEFLGERSQFQLDRTLGHILNNTATLQEIDYFFRHADELGPTVIVDRGTIVDFTDPAKKELPDAA